MRLRNYTEYDDVVLRELVRMTYSAMKRAIKRPLPTWGTVTVHASYDPLASGVNVLCIRLDKPDPVEKRVLDQLEGRQPKNPSRPQDIAYKVFCRLMAAYGYEPPSKITPDTFRWADLKFGRYLPLKPPKPPKPPRVKAKPTKRQKQERELKKILGMKKSWQRKLKFAQTRIKTLNKRERYYARALAKEGK